MYAGDELETEEGVGSLELDLQIVPTTRCECSKLNLDLQKRQVFLTTGSTLHYSSFNFIFGFGTESHQVVPDVLS